MRSFRLSYLALALLGVLIISLTWGMQAGAQEDPDDETMQLGAQVYAENCAVCHGPQGEGRVGATLAKDWPSIRPELATRATIAEGVPGSAMPAWSQENGGPLNDEEIDAVILHILNWQTGGIPEFIPGPTATRLPPISPVPDVEGDPNWGAVLYGENCAVCHGTQGEGRVGATLAKEWPAIRPDLTIKNTISIGVAGSPMVAWSEENGGPLSETEINDIVAYILSWQVEPEPTIQPTLTPFSPSWLTGWGGVALFFFLFVALITAILLFQNRK